MILMGAFCLFVCFPNLGLWISSETLQLFNIFPHLSEVKERKVLFPHFFPLGMYTYPVEFNYRRNR